MELQIAKDYVSKILKLYENASNVAIFKQVWEYKLKHIKKAKLAPTPEVVKMQDFKQNQCYKNALLVCSCMSEAKYVEGLIIIDGLPLEHAFNKIGNQYFDVTSEICLHNKIDDVKLISYFEIDGNKAIDIALKLGMATSLIQPYLSINSK